MLEIAKLEEAPVNSDQPTRKTSGGAPTINDIARIAGVSKKSVSRVLNNEAGISEATRKRIKEIMREHGYAPNRGARGLASSKSFLMGLAYNNPNPGFVMEVLGGLQEVTDPAGYEVVMHAADVAPDALPDDILTFLRRSACDAVVLTPPLSESAELIAALSSVERPVVRIAGDDVNSAMIQVKYDDRSAAQSITSRLIELGHDRIGFVGGPKESGPTRRRMQGYRDALELNGKEFTGDLIEFANFTFASGVEAGDALLALGNVPSAIFCANDEMASGVLHSARKRGLRVPDNLSVTGFDDSQLAQQVWPPLTSVRQPIREMAVRAAELALGLRAPEVSGLPDEFSHQIIERASTKRD